MRHSLSLAPGSWSRVPAANIVEAGQDPVTGDTLYETTIDAASAGKLFLRLKAEGGNN